MSDLTTDGQNALALPDPDIVFRRLPDGQGRPGEVGVHLLLRGRRISTCTIVPLTLRIGAATVRMDGIGMVGTLPQYRGRGYARRVLTVALAQMAAGDAALSMLYGIANFYLQFGYTTAGPEYTLSVPLTGLSPPLAAGWQVRPALPADLPALQRLYERSTAGAVGVVVRAPGRFPWTKLARLSPADLAGACRVVVDPQGAVAAYAWGDRESWFTRQVAQAHPHSLALAEVVARDAPAADAVLAACRDWAVEEAQARGVPLSAVVLALPPAGPLAAAARHGPVTFQQQYSAASGFMVRVLHTGRLLAALAPELERRLRAARPVVRGTLRLETDVGNVTLHLAAAGLAVEESAPARAPGEGMVVRLPQATLARLALGAYAPADLLTRLEPPPTGPTRALLEALFPLRHPHLSLPDRF